MCKLGIKISLKSSYHYHIDRHSLITCNCLENYLRGSLTLLLTTASETLTGYAMISFIQQQFSAMDNRDLAVKTSLSSIIPAVVATHRLNFESSPLIHMVNHSSTDTCSLQLPLDLVVSLAAWLLSNHTKSCQEHFCKPLTLLLASTLLQYLQLNSSLDIIVQKHMGLSLILIPCLKLLFGNMTMRVPAAHIILCLNITFLRTRRFQGGRDCHDQLSSS
jgi:hypothetical protein